MKRALLAFLLLALGGGSRADAWPSSLVEALNKDARRLLPRSLARLLAEREREILEETQRFPPAVRQALAADLTAGRLQPTTLAALDAEAARAVDLLRAQRVTEGLIRLGALLCVPADLSDPALAAGPEGYGPGVAREYYAFVEGNLDKIPVVLDDPAALKLDRTALPAYWQGMLDRSKERSPVIGVEMFRGGRVVDHRRIDFRSPVFGVAQLSYSRAVTGIAATWLAVWRNSKGDLTHQPAPRVVVPRDSPGAVAQTPPNRSLEP